jgi:hypothetical protein
MDGVSFFPAMISEVHSQLSVEEMAPPQDRSPITTQRVSSVTIRLNGFDFN